jgi:hypothetical protein
VKIGYYADSYQNAFLSGFIDDVRIYSTALSPSAIQSVKQNTYSDATCLTAHWKLNEDYGIIVSDSSGTDKHGTLMNDTPATWQPSSGYLNGAVELDGIDDYVEIQNYDGITGTNPRSISCWIKTTSQAVHNPIMHWGLEGTGARWTFTTNYDNGVAYLRAMISGGYCRGYVNNITLNDGQWHHVGVTWQVEDADNDIDNAKLYIDGIAVTTSDWVSHQVNTQQGDPVYIGKWSSNYFDGSIDDVQIYDFVLTADEISALASMGQ